MSIGAVPDCVNSVRLVSIVTHRDARKSFKQNGQARKIDANCKLNPPHMTRAIFFLSQMLCGWGGKVNWNPSHAGSNPTKENSFPYVFFLFPIFRS